jgi:hypothetical protein
LEKRKMPETIKGLPIAAQTFPEIISRKQIYVDKTSWLAMMISDGPKAWLLARPRRFGKTLAVSAFEAIFSGQSHLFEGLDIGPRLGEKTFAPRPVIRLDMGAVATNGGMDGVKRSLGRINASLAPGLGVEVDPALPPKRDFVQPHNTTRKLSKKFFSPCLICFTLPP